MISTIVMIIDLISDTLGRKLGNAICKGIDKLLPPGGDPDAGADLD